MADIFGTEDKEKSLYLIQIRYLEEQLERCQLRCGELEKQSEDLASRYGALQKDKGDTTRHLKRCVAAREKKVEELEEQLEGQRRDAQWDREALELQHRQEVQELQEQADGLRAKSRMQASQMEEQQEALTQRRADAASLEEQLLRQRGEQEAAVQRLRTEAALEREKMVEDMQRAEDDDARAELSDAPGERERAQHGEMVKRLQDQLSDGESLRVERDAARDRVRGLSASRDALKLELTRISLESLFQSTELKQLRKEVKRQTVQLRDRSIAHQQRLLQVETLRQSLASASEQRRRTVAEADQLGAELRRETGRSRQLEGAMQEAAAVLRHVLTDASEASQPEWQMQRLLEILESTAPPPPPPHPHPHPHPHPPTTGKSSRGQRPHASSSSSSFSAPTQPVRQATSPRPPQAEPAAGASTWSG